MPALPAAVRARPTHPPDRAHRPGPRGRLSAPTTMRSGIGPWNVYTIGAPSMTGMTYRGEPADFRIRHALAFSGEVMIELVQPLEGQSIWQEYLDARGAEPPPHRVLRRRLRRRDGHDARTRLAVGPGRRRLREVARRRGSPTTSTRPRSASSSRSSSHRPSGSRPNGRTRCRTPAEPPDGLSAWRRIPLCLVGCGVMGRRHLRGLAALAESACSSSSSSRCATSIPTPRARRPMTRRPSWADGRRSSPRSTRSSPTTAIVALDIATEPSTHHRLAVPGAPRRSSCPVREAAVDHGRSAAGS